MVEQAGRRQFLRTGFVTATVGIAGCSSVSPDEANPTEPSDGDDGSNGGATDGTSPTDTPTHTPNPNVVVGLETVAAGFGAPVGFEVPPNRNDRYYVLDQYGEVTVLGSDGTRETFLSVADRMVELSGYEERGLLGMALHPEFESNRRLFVRYSAPSREGTPGDYSHTFVLAEFTASDDGLRADPDSERPIMEVPQPQPNHNAGAIAFGPDGYLYVALGDGGGAGDSGNGHVEDWYDGNEGGNGQGVTENLHGSILRIDVDEEGEDRPYGIPGDNPLVGEDGLDQHYAWGFRNPWRMSFDGETLIAADVGQDDYEEVNVVGRGGNYGWNVKEGTHCFLSDSCPDETDDGEPLVDPVIEYPHSGGPVSGVTVIGGYVYEGSTIPGLSGEYLFGDWQAEGRLFAATPTDGGSWPTRVLDVVEGDRAKLEQLLSFGRDNDGELYTLGLTADGDGAVHRIVPPE